MRDRIAAFAVLLARLILAIWIGYGVLLYIEWCAIPNPDWEMPEPSP